MDIVRSTRSFESQHRIEPMNSHTKPARVILLMLLCGSLVAEAGLVRGGGRSSNTVISSSVYAGTVPFLVADPSSVDNSTLAGSLGTPFSTQGLQTAAAYGFGPIGVQTSVSHDWGRDCALNTECYFELGQSEVLDWRGHIVGLPEQLNGTSTYDAVADLIITWEMLAVEAPPPGIFTTAPLPSRSLGPDFIWSSLFSAQSDGSYAVGIGSPSVLLGETLGYLPAADEFSNCFSPNPTGPPVLPLAEAYSRGDCRQVSLDLSMETSAPTGADLRALLLANEFLSLVVTAELIAPDNFQFANLTQAGAPTGNDAIIAGVAGLATPESIRALESVEYFGCAALPGSDCDRIETNSGLLRINVVDDSASVPAPATLWLLLFGGGVFIRRRMRRS